MKQQVSEDGYWEKEIELYEKCRKLPDPFAQYYPEKKASLLTLLDYFSGLIDLKNARILEAGMGSGMALVLGVKRGAYCAGIDISKVACRFATILKEDYLDNSQKNRFEVINEDILSYSSTTKFDLVFNIGSLEHLNRQEQLRFLLKMKNLSKDYVIVGVPDYNSPIFRSFMNYCLEQNRLYKEEHLLIDVEALFNESGITLVDKLGMGIGISGKHVDKKDLGLVSFLQRTFRIDDLSELDITTDKVDWLMNIEKSLSKKDVDTYGCLDLFVGKITH